MLVCENIAKILWNYPKPTFIEYNSLPFFVKPIKLITDVTSVKIVHPPPSTISEGEEFSKKAPKIQALSKFS